MVEISIKAGPNDNTIHAVYEWTGNEWTLRQYRVSFLMPGASYRIEGGWNKVHGNQKKDIGPCLPLKRATLPK